MIRFFGMMPTVEVEKEEHYRDSEHRHYIIQAGPKGYSVIYPDHSSDWADIDSTTEDNFKAAYEIAINVAGILNRVPDPEECGEC